jgi:hypothetical protein
MESASLELTFVYGIRILSDRSAPLGARYYHPAGYGVLYAHFLCENKKERNPVSCFSIVLTPIYVELPTINKVIFV